MLDVVEYDPETKVPVLLDGVYESRVHGSGAAVPEVMYRR